MNVSTILREKGNDVLMIEADASLPRCAQALNAYHVGALVVRNPSGEFAGIISERDVLWNIVARAGDIGRTVVKDIMTPAHLVVTASPGDALDQVMQRMTSNHAHHVPVLNGRNLVGVVSIGDILRAISEAARSDNDELRPCANGIG